MAIKHQEAFRLYKAGKSVKEIAKSCGVKVRTVWQWCYLEKWKETEYEDRQLGERKKSLEKTIFEKLAGEAENITGGFVKSIALTLIMASSALDEIYQEGQTKASYREFIPEIKAIMRLLNDATGIQKNVLPEFSREMAEKMVNQIIEMRENEREKERQARMRKVM